MVRSVRIVPVVLAALLAAWSCSQSAPAPVRAAPRQLPPSPSAAAPLPLVTWYPADRIVSAQSMMPRAGDADGGLLVAGMRLTTGAVPALATEVAEPMLLGGERLPEARGGGYLFWSSNAIFSSPKFLAPLRPVAGVRGRVSSVSLGPSFALVRQADGDRWAFDPATGQRTPLVPAGMVDVAASADGLAAAVLEGGRLQVSVDGGKTWKDATGRAQPWPTSVQVERDGVWIGIGVGGALRLEKDGSLSEFAALPKAQPQPRDERWTLSQSPLERAVVRGIPLDEGTALVEASGAMVKVDLRTGAILDMTRRVLPPDMSCESMRLGGQVLVACQGQGGRLVAAGPLDGEPALEKTFRAEGRFSAAGANLLFEGPCEGSDKLPGVICMRRGGLWSQLDASSALGEPDAGPGPGSQRTAPSEVTRWIPGEEQGAIGVVQRPVFGFLHARGGVFVECEKGCAAARVDSLRSRERDDIIDRTWVMTRDGSLRGWTRDGAVTVLLDGHVMQSPWRWHAVRGVGPLGIAWDREGRLWQSPNWGEGWNEVAGPPWKDSGRDPMLCSEVGCQLSAWLRLGWRAEQPGVLPKPAVARAPAVSRSASAPQLSCVGTGERRTATRSADEVPNAEVEVGLGARLFTRSQGEESFFRVTYGLGPLHPVLSPQQTAFGYAAMMHAKVPEVVDAPAGPAPAGPRVLENLYTWWYAEPFEPAMTLRSSTMRLRQLAEAAGVHRQALLTFTSDEDRSAVPVLSSTAGKADGVLLHLEGGLWAWVRSRAQGAILMLAPVAELAEGSEILAAVATGPDRVVILAAETDGAERVLELERGKARTMFFVPPPPRAGMYPANADALAVDGQGNVAVLRTPSGSEPASAEDPALVLTAAGARAELAPWSTLAAADEGQCVGEGSGYRAILHTQRAWLDVRNANIPLDGSRGMLAMVRWNATRVCLEAVVAGAEPVELRGEEASTAYVARFAGKREAARVGLTLGSEYRAGQTCTLRQSP